MTDHLESATRLYLVQEIERLRGDLGVAAITESMLRTTINVVRTLSDRYKTALENICVHAEHQDAVGNEADANVICKIARDALEV